MASVKHLGLFPWCVYKNRETFLEKEVGPLIQGYLPYQLIFESFVTDVPTSVGLYWRVKSWAVSGYFNATVYFGENPVTIQQQISVPFNFVFTRSAASERSLVCRDAETGMFPQLTSNASVSYSLALFDNPFTSTDFDLQIGVVSNPIVPNNFGFYTSEDFTSISNFISFVFGHIDGEANRSANYITQVAPQVGGPTSITLSAFGKDFSLPAYVGEGSGTSMIGFAEAAITANEYWPYDPEDGGGPIYDTSSGAIIRPDYFKPQN